MHRAIDKSVCSHLDPQKQNDPKASATTATGGRTWHCAHDTSFLSYRIMRTTTQIAKEGLGVLTLCGRVRIAAATLATTVHEAGSVRTKTNGNPRKLEVSGTRKDQESCKQASTASPKQ